MKKVLLILFLSGLFSCGKSDKEIKEMLDNQKEIIIHELANKEANSPKYKEKNNPLNYVTIIKSKVEPDYLGNLKFEVTIKNKAQYTTYKEAEITIEWLDQSGNVTATNNWKESGHSYSPGVEHIIKFKTKAPYDNVKSYRPLLKRVYYNGQL